MADKAETVTSTLMNSTLVQYFGIFGLYLPVTYILAGALADIVSQQWRVSGASLSALIAVVLNFIGHRIADYMGSTSSKMQSGILSGNAGNLSGIYSGCTVPGFEGFESMLAPQSLVIIFAMTTFFFIDIKQNYSGQSISGLIGLTVVATLLQIFVLMTNVCWTPDFYASWIPNKTLMLIPILFAGVFGVAGAGLGYLINNVIKKALPVAAVPTTVKTTQADGPVATSGSGFGSALPPVGGSDGGGSGSSSDDQFVCEAYKNGELVTSTITE
jgi:hypothetical protein